MLSNYHFITNNREWYQMGKLVSPAPSARVQLDGGGTVTDLPTTNFALCILHLLKDKISW